MRDFTKISHFLFKKVGQIISRILCFPRGKCLSFIWMGCCQTILTAYPPTLSEPLLVVGLLGVAPYRVYLISLWHYPYILSVALVLALRRTGVTRYSALWCPDFPLPEGSDKLIYPTLLSE